MVSETGQGGCWGGAWGSQLESRQGSILSSLRRGATLRVSPRARLELLVGNVPHRRGTALCHIGREFTLPQFSFGPSRRMPRWGASLFNTPFLQGESRPQAWSLKQATVSSWDVMTFHCI